LSARALSCEHGGAAAGEGADQEGEQGHRGYGRKDGQEPYPRLGAAEGDPDVQGEVVRRHVALVMDDQAEQVGQVPVRRGEAVALVQPEALAPEEEQGGHRRQRRRQGRHDEAG
jgi:hypothetical protein